VSFSDRPNYGSWRHIDCFIIGSAIMVVNALFLLSWYFTYYDLSTQEYLQLGFRDLIVPAMLTLSAGLLWLIYRLLLRDKT